MGAVPIRYVHTLVLYETGAGQALQAAPGYFEGPSNAKSPWRSLARPVPARILGGLTVSLKVSLQAHNCARSRTTKCVVFPPESTTFRAVLITAAPVRENTDGFAFTATYQNITRSATGRIQRHKNKKRDRRGYGRVLHLYRVLSFGGPNS